MRASLAQSRSYGNYPSHNADAPRVRPSSTPTQPYLLALLCDSPLRLDYDASPLLQWCLQKWGTLRSTNQQPNWNLTSQRLKQAFRREIPNRIADAGSTCSEVVALPSFPLARGLGCRQRTASRELALQPAACRAHTHTSYRPEETSARSYSPVIGLRKSSTCGSSLESFIITDLADLSYGLRYHAMGFGVWCRSLACRPTSSAAQGTLAGSCITLEHESRRKLHC